MEAKYAIGDFRFGLGYDKTKIYDSKTDEDIKHLADRIKGKIGYSPSDELDLEVKISHYLAPNPNPESYISGGKEYFYVDKDFTLVDFAGSYEIKHGVVNFLDGAKVSFGVNNLFDRPYINAHSTKDSYLVGTGRNFYVDLEVKF
ncbi:MAG: TonB-dependent receptor [Campylobacter sp.]|nr:TonB-dependent receptor [Campylobacter sp.]MBP3725075.1 TonB-dependent receptor [Campylobacter sp.]